MKDAPPLYILRHGETEWNASGRLQGHHHSPLTPLGRTQAREQRRILRARDLRGFGAFSSPQERALETANIALDGVIAPVQSAPALREIGLGDWAGRDRAGLIAETRAVDGFDLYSLAPRGEGFDALRSRCEQFLAALRAPAVLVTHGITSRMLRLVLTGQPTEKLRDQPGGQGVVFHVENGRQHRLAFGA